MLRERKFVESVCYGVWGKTQSKGDSRFLCLKITKPKLVCGDTRVVQI